MQRGTQCEGQQIIIVAEPAKRILVGLVRIQTIDKSTYELYDQVDDKNWANTIHLKFAKRTPQVVK